MSRPLLLIAVVLAGCASTPEHKAPPRAIAFDRFELLLEEIAAWHEHNRWAYYPEGKQRLHDALTEAATLATTDAQRTQLETWLWKAERNHKAELDYMAAIEIVNSRDRSRYSDAQALLRGVPRGALIYQDARAYLDWIDADLLVCAAADAFDSGDLASAVTKLDQAEAFEVLGPEAKESVRSRRAKWLEATRACRAGLSAIAEDRAADADAAFRAIVAGTSEKRAVHQLAKSYLAHLKGELEDLPAEALALGGTLQRVDPELIAAPPVPAEKPADETGDAHADEAEDPARAEPAEEAPATADDWADDFEDWGDDDWDDSKPAARAGDDAWDDSKPAAKAKANEQTEGDDVWSDDFEEWDDDDWKGDDWKDSDDWKGELAKPTKAAPGVPDPPKPLDPPAIVTGRVQLPNGRPVPGASVSMGYKGTLVDASGRFRISTTGRTVKRLRVSKRPLVPVILVEHPPLQAGETRDLGVLVLRPGGGFSFRFVNAAGDPVNAKGTLWYREFGETFETGTELEGVSTFEWYPDEVLVSNLRFDLEGFEELTFAKVENGTHDLVVTLTRATHKKTQRSNPDEDW